jgi:hypothetical protein
MAFERGVSSLALLASIVDRPTDALAQVTATPQRRWLLPTFLIILSIAVYLAFAAPYLQKATLEAARLQLNTMPADQAAAAEQQMARFTSLPMITGSTAVTALIGTLISWLVAAALLYFTTLISGEDITFGQMFSLAPWLWLPYALQGFVQAAWVAVQRGLILAPGLSGLVTTGNLVEDSRNLTFALLSRIDLFALWHVVLVYAGLRGLTRMGATKAVVLTVIYAALSLAVHLAPTLIARAFA